MNEQSVLYLAYGSNCHLGQMKKRCPGAKVIGKVDLKGYRLVYRRGFLTLLQDKKCKTTCAVWQLSVRNLKNLDRYEGYPKVYDKKTIYLDIGNGEVGSAVVYIMQPRYNTSYVIPSDDYQRKCMKGYFDCGIDLKQLDDAFDEVIEKKLAISDDNVRKNDGKEAIKMEIAIGGRELKGSAVEILDKLRQASQRRRGEEMSLAYFFEEMCDDYYLMNGEHIQVMGDLETDIKTLFDKLNEVGVLEYIDKKTY